MCIRDRYIRETKKASLRPLRDKVISILKKKRFFPYAELFEYFKGEKQEVLQVLKKLRNKLNLKNVIFIDPIPRSKVPEMLSKSLIGIVPLKADKSLKYARPTKLYEYMSCGLPIVAYGLSVEVKKILEKSKAGVYVEGNDHRKVAKVIINLLSNPKLMEKMAQNARKYIIQNYSSDLISQRLSEILSSNMQ